MSNAAAGKNSAPSPEPARSSWIAGFAHSLFPHPRYYGWRIVAMGFLACMFSAPGQTFLISLFIDPLIVALETNRLTFSLLYSGGTLAAALCTPFAGRVVDRVSSRFFFGAVLGGLGFSLLGLAWAPSLAFVALALFLLRLFGQGAINIGVIKTSTGWFNLRRGRAIAIGGLGFAFGELCLPAPVQHLMEYAGWRGALTAIGIVYLALIAPGIAFAMRPSRPGEGKHEHPPVPPQGLAAGVEAVRTASVWKDAAFLPLLAGVCLQPFVMTALIFHQVALVKNWGWGASSVTTVLAAFAIGRIVCSYSSGILFERISGVWGVSFSAVCTALACGSAYVGLPFAAAPFVYGALLGISSGFASSGNAIMWQERYGAGGLGQLQGTVSAFRNGITALSAPLAAWLMMISGGPGTLVAGMAFLALAVSMMPVVLRLTGVQFGGWDGESRLALETGGSAASAD